MNQSTCWVLVVKRRRNGCWMPTAAWTWRKRKQRKVSPFHPCWVIDKYFLAYSLFKQNCTEWVPAKMETPGNTALRITHYMSTLAPGSKPHGSLHLITLNKRVPRKDSCSKLWRYQCNLLPDKHDPYLNNDHQNYTLMLRSALAVVPWGRTS